MRIILAVFTIILSSLIPLSITVLFCSFTLVSGNIKVSCLLKEEIADEVRWFRDVLKWIELTMRTKSLYESLHIISSIVSIEDERLINEEGWLNFNCSIILKENAKLFVSLLFGIELFNKSLKDDI